MATSAKISLTRVLIIIIGAIGVLMLVIGTVVYATASSELGNQKISVAALDSSNPGPHAGQPVRGPITALAQIQAISHHMQNSSRTATGGQRDATTGIVTGGNPDVTYGTAPSFSLDAQGNCAGDLATWTDPAGNGTITCTKGAPPEVTGTLNAAQLAGLRGTLTTGSFLVASLFVSEIAFGVAALLFGLGIVFLLIFVAGWRLTGKPAVATPAEAAAE